MNRNRRDGRSDIALLASDAALARFFGESAAATLWSAGDGKLVWASPAGAHLAAVLSPLALARVKVLAAGVAPSSGVRLERLRVLAGARVDLITCVCRMVDLASGHRALLLAATSPLPASVAAAAPMPVHAWHGWSPPAEAASTSPERADGRHGAPDPLAAVRALAQERRTIRFVWETDAGGTFVRVSPDLAAVVGAASAALVGRTWRDLETIVVQDVEAAVARLLASRATWSGRGVIWRVAGTRAGIPVELAGVPLLDATRQFAGFRGFGLCRPGGIQEAAWPEADGIAAATAAGIRAVESPPSSEEPAEAAAERPAPAPSPVASLLATPDGAARPAKPTSVLLPFPGMKSSVPAQMGGPRPPLRVVEAPPAGPAGDPAADRAAASGKSAPGESAPARPAREAIGGLSSSERNAFREIARALGARFAGDMGEEPPPATGPEPSGEAETAGAAPAQAPPPASAQPAAAAAPADSPVPADSGVLAGFIDRLPLGVIVNRGETPVHANRAFLELTGFSSLDDLTARGFGGLFGNPPRANDAESADAPVALITASGEMLAAEVRLATVDWEGVPASLMTFRRAVQPETERRLRALEQDLKAREGREAELTSILDTATDGVIVLDERGRILSLNRSAEALFGYEQNEVAGESFPLLLATESHALALDYLEGLKANGVASVLNDGREVTGRVRQGGKIPLFMTIGRVGDNPERKFCAVLRDMTAWKKAEGELLEARRVAERASAHKSDFLAKMSHEIRTPLSAIIGFSEVMLEERLGPVGNERYKEYLKDIHTSGGHVISLVNDLLDLAKIEAGRLELDFTSVDLNEIVSGCVALMQPQAGRERIVLRKSLATKLPPVVADARSMRQIMLNILSNAVKFTDAGGQVIVSTTMTDRGDVTLRVRDTGIGMTEKEIEAALEPFRQLATARRAGGTGLGLPLTKALVEANRGALAITSARGEGTLVEIVMPRTRVLAE